MNSESDSILWTSYIIDKVLLESRIAIPRHVLANTEIIKLEDHVCDGLVYHFRSFLAGKKHEVERSEESIKVPNSWWDHAKERFAPKWFLKQWPISYRTIATKTVFSFTDICPHIELPKNDKAHFEWLTTKTNLQGDNHEQYQKLGKPDR